MCRVIVWTAEKGRSTAATLGAPSSRQALSPATAARGGRPAALRERSSVLVVDDDPALRRLVIETLARDGGELREAADGLEALAMIAVRPPDVLVLDLAMPKLDGFGVLERLLEGVETRQMPVVVLTGRDLTGAERRLLRERKARCWRSASTRATSCAGSCARPSARSPSSPQYPSALPRRRRGTPGVRPGRPGQARRTRRPAPGASGAPPAGPDAGCP